MKVTNKLKEHTEIYLRHVLNIIEVFVNQKRIDLCEHTRCMHTSFLVLLRDGPTK